MASKFRRQKFKDPGDHEISNCDHKLHGKYIHAKVSRAIDGKEIVVVKQGIHNNRNIIVPNRNPLDVAGIFRKSEFDRLTKQSTVVSPAERQAMIIEAENKIFVAREESDKRKAALLKAQLFQRAEPNSVLGIVRKSNQLYTDRSPKKTATYKYIRKLIEEEADNNSKYVLARAVEIKNENEEEVRGVNGVILATKCKAIREAQIQEKELIKRELEDEDRRLDMMMERTRQLGLREEAKKRQLEVERNKIFTTQIMQQIKEVELAQLIGSEQKEEEARMVKKALVAFQREEIEIEHQKLVKREKIQAEQKKANDDMEKYKARQLEEARLCDMRLKEFMRKKNEREMAEIKEKQEVKAAKEREIQRMREHQSKVADLQTLKDEQNAQRIQEEKDREYRQKELEAAIKKKAENDKLRIDRKKQIEDIRKAQAVQMLRDEDECRKLAAAQHGMFKKDQANLALRRDLASQNRKYLLKQVEEKERVRIDNRRIMIEDGKALRMEKELRDNTVLQTIQKKIDGLKDLNVPENCIHDIKRQVNLKLEKIRNRI